MRTALFLIMAMFSNISIAEPLQQKATEACNEKPESGRLNPNVRTNRSELMNIEERNYEQFPDDSNGAVLWHMHSKGDSLSTPREVDFTAIFPSEEAALDFATLFLRARWKVEIFEAEPNDRDNLNWEVVLYTTIVPTHLKISELEVSIMKWAQELGGRTDGWSSVLVKSP